jgi:hypothetical protein
MTGFARNCLLKSGRKEITEEENRKLARQHVGRGRPGDTCFAASCSVPTTQQTGSSSRRRKRRRRTLDPLLTRVHPKYTLYNLICF